MTLGAGTETPVDTLDSLDAINSTEAVRIVTNSVNAGAGVAITLNGITTSGDSVELVAAEDIDLDAAIDSAGGVGTLLIRTLNANTAIGLGSDRAGSEGGANAGVFLDDTSVGFIDGSGFGLVQIGQNEQSMVTVDLTTGSLGFAVDTIFDVDGTSG